MLYADPRWLLAEVEGGLLAAGDGKEMEIEIEAPTDARLRLLDCLMNGADAASVGRLAGVGRAEAGELLKRLREAGALCDVPVSRARPRGIALRDAILAGARGEPISGHVWTAEELLVLPGGLGPDLVRETVRAFVAGLRNDARLRAYCRVAEHGAPTTRGDRPDSEPLRRALDVIKNGSRAIQVVRLADGHLESVSAGSVGSLGASSVHRLGTVIAETGREILPGLHHRAAMHAIPGLRRPRAAAERICRGTASSPSRATLIARAEAAERYAAGDIEDREPVRARGAELPRSVGMDELVCFNTRQLASSPDIERYSQDEAYLWIRAETLRGAECWAPAEAVFCPFTDPERERSLSAGTTTSGAAAHGSRALAVEHALCEVVERDAFVWHWLQRVSRERLEPKSLPDRERQLIGQIERQGLQVDLVNLTLETLPVVLCALTGESGLFLGCACRRDAPSAAAKALTEAYAVAWTELVGRPRPEPISAEQVRGPGDHLRFHRQSPARAGAEFLRSSPEAVKADEIEISRGPIADKVAPLGEPLVIDLGSPATRPFHVVRALVPGAIPLTFGYDREPLGMPGLARPRTIRNGATVGGFIDMSRSGPIAPHPFG